MSFHTFPFVIYGRILYAESEDKTMQIISFGKNGRNTV